MADLDWQHFTRTYLPPALLVTLFLFMVWVRTRPAEIVITKSSVGFSGNDPWYHARMVQYTVRYFPSTPNFDPFSYFPYGTGRHSGFGGLFDQLIALATLVAGLGSPNPHFVNVVTAYAPSVFGALTVVPMYLVAKRLVGRLPALLSAVLLALVNGQFLTRTIVGVSDHQSAEAFFGTLSVLGFVYAIETAYTEQPTPEDFADRNWLVLKRPVIAGVLGGLAVAAYLMLWAPGVMLAFTMGVFVLIQLTREHVLGKSTHYLAFATAVSMLTAALVTLAYAKSYTLAATSFSLLQPLVLAGITIGAVVLTALSEYFRIKGYDSRNFPPTVGALILGSLSVATVVYPPVLGMLKNLVVRIYSFGLLSSSTALTVAEIAPATFGDAWRAYAALFILAIIGFFVLTYRVVMEDRPIELLVVLWSLTITSAYFTMIRFGYYMGVIVALLAGYAVWWTLRTVNITEINDISDIETYQVIVVLIVVVTIIPGTVVTVEGTSPPAWETAENRSGANPAWQAELSWLNANTPEEPLEYYGQFNPPEDGDYDYPVGTYGVMSWWDYGHWITVAGKRIPNANPFQEGPRPASAYLLAANETRANLILEALPSRDVRGEIPEMSHKELRSTIAAQNPQQRQENTRYVMIDDQMAAGKFGAIATWTGPGFEEGYLVQQEFRLLSGGTANVVGLNERYHQTMLARLYFQDARGLSHYRLVHETQSQTSIVSVAQRQPAGSYRTVVLNERLSQPLLSTVQQRSDLSFFDVRQASTVKTFERVPGARLVGTVPNTTEPTSVTAGVRLETNTGRNVTYSQRVQTDAHGNFEITVPYSTDNSLGVNDDATNESVIATGDYTVVAGSIFQRTASGEVAVPEIAIYDGSTIEVDLEPVEQSDPSANGNISENSSSKRVIDLHTSSPTSISPGLMTPDTLPSSPVAASRS